MAVTFSCKRVETISCFMLIVLLFVE